MAIVLLVIKTGLALLLLYVAYAVSRIAVRALYDRRSGNPRSIPDLLWDSRLPQRVPMLILVVGLSITTVALWPSFSAFLPAESTANPTDTAPSILPPATDQPENHGFSVIWLLVGIGLGLAGILAVASDNRSARAAGGLTLLLSAAAIGKFQLTGMSFHLDRLATLALTFNRSLTFDTVATIGPFASSNDTLPSAVADSQLRRVASILLSVVERSQGRLLLIVGGVDKRPVRGEAASRYGSNEGLAQARANWVLRSLHHRDARLASFTSIALPAGAQHFGQELPTSILQRDRTVRVLIAAPPRR
jgi:hypothetical protein